jgi:hypothetical protein
VLLEQPESLVTRVLLEELEHLVVLVHPEQRD